MTAKGKARLALRPAGFFLRSEGAFPPLASSMPSPRQASPPRPDGESVPAITICGQIHYSSGFRVGAPTFCLDELTECRDRRLEIRNPHRWGLQRGRRWGLW